MSDVDDELLALAGGDMSSDEEEQQQPSKKEKHSVERDDEDEEEDDAPMNISRSGSESPAPRAATPAKKKESSAPKGVAVKKTPAKKARRRARSDDGSEEEGEASSIPGSPSSLQSAPMEESDSESDGEVAPKKGRGAAAANDDDDDDENKYPVDGLFMSHEEKEDIMNMREVEREQILAERAQEKDRIHQNKLLRQLVSNDEQRKKRSASTADLNDEGQRKTSRVRTKLGGTKVGETSSAMDTLKTRRAEKHERTRRREEDRERRKSHASPRGGDDDDDFDLGGGDESDVEWAKPSRKSPTPEVKESQTPELHDIERIRLSRSRFSQVCFFPGFEDAVRGSFVRISIGPDPETGANVYRMAIVKGFVKGRPYALTGEEGRQIVTDQYVLAAHGKAQREWPFLSCSDGRFTEAEWSRYQKVCHSEDVTLPKRGILLNKADDINKLINRVWTENELVEKVNRQNALKNKFNGVDRMKLEYAIKEAKALGNFERVRQLQEEMDTLETPRLAYKTSLNQVSSSQGSNGTPDSMPGRTQQERLAQLNAENRRRNAEEVRKAQLKERARARAIERKIERGEEVEEDTSRRLKTRAKFVHDVNEAADKKRSSSQAGSGASTPANGTPRLGAQKSTTLLPHMAKLQQQQKASATNKSGLPTIHKPIVDDDVIAAMDLDIDDNILDD